MDYLLEPFAHQKALIARVKDYPHYALLWDMGTGKSKTVIDLVRYKCYHEQKPLNTLIIAPNIALSNWGNELTMNSRFTFSILQGSKKERIAKLNSSTPIKIINYDGLQVIKEELLSFPWDIIICDESQRIKGYKTIRTKVACALAKVAKYRYILSGTPVINNPLDIFSQYLFLDLGATFGTSFFSFRNKYFEDKNARRRGTRYYFPDWKPKPDIIPLLNNLIMQKADTLKKEECLDLPEQVFVTANVKMTEEQKKAYKNMKEFLITYFEEHPVTAATAVVKLIRLNQISSGYVGAEDGVERRFKTNPKLEAVKEILEDIAQDHKVIIWAVFRDNIKQLASELASYNPAVIWGDTVDKQAEQDKFKHDPLCRICIANPMSAGLAINLVEADYAIYFSYNYSLEERLQSIARNHRAGSEIHSKITYIDLICEETVDKDILEALKNKENIAEKIISKLHH